MDLHEAWRSIQHGGAALFGQLNALDWVLLILVTVSTVTAFAKGLIRSLIALVGLAAGIGVGAWYAPALARRFAGIVEPYALAGVVAFLLVVSGIYVLAITVARLLGGAVSAAGLGLVDRLGGACFGFARMVLLLAAVLLPAAQFLPEVPGARESIFLPYLLSASHGILLVVPQEFGRRLQTDAWLPRVNFPNGRAAHSRLPGGVHSDATAVDEGEAP